MALVKDAALDRWTLFDDASASVVGDWAAVAAKCAAGRIQPAVLFFVGYDPAGVADGGGGGAGAAARGGGGVCWAAAD